MPLFQNITYSKGFHQLIKPKILVFILLPCNFSVKMTQLKPPSTSYLHFWHNVVESKKWTDKKIIVWSWFMNMPNYLLNTYCLRCFHLSIILFYLISFLSSLVHPSNSLDRTMKASKSYLRPKYLIRRAGMSTEGDWCLKHQLTYISGKIIS